MAAIQKQGQCEARAESTSLLNGYAEPKPALGKAKGRVKREESHACMSFPERDCSRQSQGQDDG